MIVGSTVVVTSSCTPHCVSRSILTQCNQIILRPSNIHCGSSALSDYSVVSLHKVLFLVSLPVVCSFLHCFCLGALA